MDAARIPQPGATKGPSRQDLLRIYEQTSAKGLLARTELSISGVAQACGFSHQGHLARHFRNLLGTTPGEFRREFSR
jgi:transcriptional regulator GlxA family with amidase domain